MAATRSVSLGLGLVVSVLGASRLIAQTQPTPAQPTIIFRGPASPAHSQNETLRVVIHDVDSPDRSITQAYVLITAVGAGSQGKPPRSVIWNEQGLVPSVSLENGDYVVLVRRVGYREARFAIRVAAACEQVLDVYLAQAVVILDRCMVRTAGSPPCDSRSAVNAKSRDVHDLHTRCITNLEVDDSTPGVIALQLCDDD